MVRIVFCYRFYCRLQHDGTHVLSLAGESEMARFAVYLCGNRDGFGCSLGTLLVLCMGLLFAAPLRNIESVGRRFGESRRCDRDYYRHLAIFPTGYSPEYVVDF